MQGNFEFLGALCFPEDKGGNSVLEIEVLTKAEAPPDLAILMYDDQPESFDMVRLIWYQDTTCNLSKHDIEINFDWR